MPAGADDLVAGGQFLLPDRRSGRHRLEQGALSPGHQRGPAESALRRPGADLGGGRVSLGAAWARGGGKDKQGIEIHTICGVKPIRRLRFPSAYRLQFFSMALVNASFPARIPFSYPVIFHGGTRALR